MRLLKLQLIHLSPISNTGHTHKRPATQVPLVRLAVQGAGLAVQPLHQTARDIDQGRGGQVQASQSGGNGGCSPVLPPLSDRSP